MLRFLRIRDFALIRELEIEFGSGLNLLTGETGSGKSIIVDALGLLLGERSSQEMVRTGCDTAIVEGVFTPDSQGQVAKLLNDSGFRAEEKELLIRREISSAGRSRVYLNDGLATLSLLKAMGEKFADIHGQQDRHTLLDFSTHLQWLDRSCQTEEMVGEVRQLFVKLREISAALDAMQMNEQERLRRVDILEFQRDEIRRANLKAHEQEALETEKKILVHREKVAALSAEAYGLLYESDASLLSQANRLLRILQELEAYDSSWAAHRESIRESLYKLEDLAYAARDYSARIDFTPERLEEVEQRLSDLRRLSQKYGSSVEEMLAHAGKCESELDQLLSISDSSRRLEQQLEALLKSYLSIAQRLSEKRRQGALVLEQALRKEFRALSMEKMLLGIHFDVRDREASSGRIPGRCGPDGVDRVEFLVAANKGEDLKPLAKVASGGELSRIMLAIRSLCGGGDPDKTLVFDEVDAGIGGRAAEAVGRRLRDIARRHQVLCVTHLPQIAAFASRHFSVHKEVVGARTETFVKRLDDAERIQEVARMLGGEIVTETARHHAREMLALSLSGAGREGQARR